MLGEMARAALGLLVLAAVGSCIVSVSWLLSAPAAQAEEYQPPAGQATEPAPPEDQPDCADAPEPPGEAAGEVAAEVRRARIDRAADCQALTSRIDQLRQRVWWVVLQQLVAEGDRGQLVQTVAALLDRAEAPREVLAQEPLAVHDDQLATSSAGVAESVDAAGQATRGALWYLIGALVAAVVGAFIYRQVMPRG